MSVQIPPELLDRMVALVRGLAAWPSSSTPPPRFDAEARNIAALLPDLDLEAAEGLADANRPPTGPDYMRRWAVASALAGIKHGRGQ